VSEIGLPLMRTGERQTGIGFPLFGPRRKTPSACKRRIAAFSEEARIRLRFFENIAVASIR